MQENTPITCMKKENYDEKKSTNKHQRIAIHPEFKLVWLRGVRFALLLLEYLFGCVTS